MDRGEVEGDLGDGVIGIAIEETAAEGAIGRSSICIEFIQDIGPALPLKRLPLKVP